MRSRRSAFKIGPWGLAVYEAAFTTRGGPHHAGRLLLLRRALARLQRQTAGASQQYFLLTLKQLVEYPSTPSSAVSLYCQLTNHFSHFSKTLIINDHVHEGGHVSTSKTIINLLSSVHNTPPFCTPPTQYHLSRSTLLNSKPYFF